MSADDLVGSGSCLKRNRNPHRQNRNFACIEFVATVIESQKSGAIVTLTIARHVAINTTLILSKKAKMSSILFRKESLILIRTLLKISLECDNIHQNLDDFCTILGLQEYEWMYFVYDYPNMAQAALSERTINAIYPHIYVPIAQAGEAIVLDSRKFQSPSEFIDYVKRN